MEAQDAGFKRGGKSSVMLLRFQRRLKCCCSPELKEMNVILGFFVIFLSFDELESLFVVFERIWGIRSSGLKILSFFLCANALSIYR